MKQFNVTIDQASIVPFLVQQQQTVSLSNISLNKEGIPTVIFSNELKITYHPTMKTWMILAEPHVEDSPFTLMEHKYHLTSIEVII
jgi:hypothetical protein